MPRHPIRTRLHLERLETRVVPATPVIALGTLGNRGATLRDFENNARAGYSVSGAGDVNGDGFHDVIVGANLTNAGGSNRGETYVVFGGSGLGGTLPPLNALGTGGFTLRGFENDARAGNSVSEAGDVNGDGFDDLIVGAPFTAAGGNNRGEAYVVFGGSGLGGTTLTLNALGTGGFTLRGFEDDAFAGVSVSGAGDVNGDGFDDLIVGASSADAGGTLRGEAYVVFGGSALAGTTLTLNALGTSGFTLRGFEDGALAGFSVSGAGDVNGDGFDDLLLGARQTNAGGINRGEAYVVFGGSGLGGTALILNALGTGGFTLRGFENDAEAGLGVSGAGDVNGDGFDDLIVGARFTDAGGADRGEAYVVFGGSGRDGTTVLLNALGTGGFTLRGFEDDANAGRSVSGAGDVNGDGFDDVIIGADRADAGGAVGANRGEAYVVFGGPARAGTTITLNNLDSGGLTLRGFENSALAGTSVSGAGDVNGDGFDDLLLGAPFTNAGGSDRGEAYVVFAPLPPTYAVGTGAGTAARVTVFDAKSGQPRTSFLPYGAFAGGVRVATGDINGDGADDLITGPGAGGGPNVKVFDGRTFQLLASFNAYPITFTGGVWVASGDVDGDGRDDVVTGPGAEAGPHVKAFSGANLAVVLRSFFAYAATFTKGVTVAAADLNGDGRADLVTGPGQGGGPNVKVFDGTNPAIVLRNFLAFAPTFTGGVFVAAGDVNGNGFADLVVGAGPGARPHVKVFSHAGALMDSFFAYATTFAGGVRVAAADVNGDGKADLVTGAGANGGPHLRAFRGVGHAPLRSAFVGDPSFLGGIFVG